MYLAYWVSVRVRRSSNRDFRVRWLFTPEPDLDFHSCVFPLDPYSGGPSF